MLKKTWMIIIVLLWSLLAYAGEYYMPAPGDDVVGRNYTIIVKSGDSLTSIRQDHGVSYDELLEANPKINFYRLRVGQEIIVPKQFILPKIRHGVVINIPELRLYYFTPDGDYVYTFPVGLGRPNWRTPVMVTKIVNKKEDPVWVVPDSIRDYVYNKTGEILPDRVEPGPKNPLGKYALYLADGGYRIHGTNAPTSVGTFISSGCIRMLSQPIETLYQKISVGTPVYIIHHPYKAGWLNGKLYLESHKSISSYPDKPNTDLDDSDVEQVIYDAIHLRPARINWSFVQKNVKEKLGIPEVIGY